MITESNLCVNKSIKHLAVNFRTITNVSFEFMTALLRKTPNVTHLEMYRLDQKMMAFLSITHKNLKSLKFRELNNDVDLTSPELFPILESFEIDHIYTKLKKCLLAIPEYKQTRLVKLLLNSDYEVF